MPAKKPTTTPIPLHLVEYLRAANNYDGPLAIRLKSYHQPVLCIPNAFSTPHSTLSGQHIVR
jgi:hypothetical protein